MKFAIFTNFLRANNIFINSHFFHIDFALEDKLVIVIRTPWSLICLQPVDGVYWMMPTTETEIVRFLQTAEYIKIISDDNVEQDVLSHLRREQHWRHCVISVIDANNIRTWELLPGDATDDILEYVRSLQRRNQRESCRHRFVFDLDGDSNAYENWPADLKESGHASVVLQAAVRMRLLMERHQRRMLSKHLFSIFQSTPKGALLNADVEAIILENTLHHHPHEF
jgi:hypothetical protein